MASKNLEQGIQAIQQQDMTQGKRLLKIALKNDPLNAQERVQALTWLAETDTNPQFRIEQYQQAIQLDPTNQDIINRLTYWSQQAQQQQNQQPSTSTQGMPAANPPFTSTQSMNPIQPNQQPNWQQTPQQQQFNQQFTPSQPMQPIQPNQVPNQEQTPQQQQFNQQFTPSQPMQPIQQDFNQGFTQSSTQQFAAQQGQPIPSQQPVYGQQPVIQLQQVQRTVGIIGGANGTGTGFFATRDGLIATTRHVVGGEHQINVQLLDGRQLVGEVVRSFPDVDVTLLKVNVQVAHLLGVSQAPMIPDDTPIVAVTHAGEGIRSAKRRSINEIEQFWFPTIINHMKDAGGNPVFDTNNMLVGMLTNNASRSNGYMYGLHIHKVYQCIDQYIHEKGQLEGQNTLYCNACGINSRAPSFGGYFCENCGNTHPYAVNIERFPQTNLASLYGEDSKRPCPNCASQVGFYNRECMRCGYQL